MFSLARLRTAAISLLVVAELALFLIPAIEAVWPWAMHQGVQPGSWPDWIVASATVLAVAFAGLAARAAIQTNKDQAKQIDLLRADQERLAFTHL